MSEARYAYATFLLGDGRYLPGALLFAYGLRRQRTKADILCIVSGSLPQEVRDALLTLYDDAITIVAKRAPVARDLRVIMSISKTITDLERIGDEAARIAHIAKGMFESERSLPGGHLMRDVLNMGQLAVQMLEQALASFDALNATQARALVCRDNDLDMEFQSSLRRLATFLLEDARNVGHAIHIVLLIKAIERIGDHARNIAEYVIYMVQGQDVRHRLASYCEAESTAKVASEAVKHSKS